MHHPQATVTEKLNTNDILPPTLRHTLRHMLLSTKRQQTKRTGSVLACGDVTGPEGEARKAHPYLKEKTEEVSKMTFK